MTDEKIALYFTPQNDGDHLIGLPARDMTEADVAEYREREPFLLLSATTPHPVTGRTLYTSAEAQEEEKSLHAMTRPELNAYAEKQGVENAESFPNKDTLIDAINAAKNPANLEGDDTDTSGDADGANLSDPAVVTDTAEE
jgi:hypothetical protein